MQALKLKRGTLKASLTKLRTAVDGYNLDAINRANVDAHQRRLDGLWADLQSNHDEIIAASADQAERDAHQRDFDEVDSKVLELQTSLNTAMLRIVQPHSTSQTTPTQTNEPVNHSLSVNLPKLSIPTYSGEVHEWLAFSDMFTTMVHSNQSLEDVNRFQYLKLALKGDAARHLNSIPVTNSNYRKAWEMLEARFSHERVMVFSHLDRLFDHPELSQESATGLRKLIDNTNESVRALENLKRSTDQWDDILVYLTMQKLDPETRRRLELSLTDKKVPSYQHLMELLEQHSIALDTMSNSRSKGKSQDFSNKGKGQGKYDKGKAPANAKSHVAAAQSKQCSYCEDNHNIFQCTTFNERSIPERVQLVKEKKLCMNCLRSGHFASNCSSTSTCRVCKQKHHTLLHLLTSTSESAVVATHHSSSQQRSQVLLATALVLVNNSRGSQLSCRVLLDGGSQASFISTACVNRLGIKEEKAICSISGISASNAVTSTSEVTFQVHSRVEAAAAITVNALVLKRITGNLPTFTCNPCQWNHLSGLKLADPLFHKPHGVDILLGADVIPEIIRPNLVRGPPQTPTAQETAFGWIVFGPAAPLTKTSVVSHVGHVDLDSTLQRFWEIEDVSQSRKFTQEETSCESHYAETHSRQSDGSYMVRLPFKQLSECKLGNSYAAALRRFKQLERRLQTNFELHNQYSSFMSEYLSMGHMEVVPNNEVDKEDGVCYYLPHHSVVKEDSTTTKLRVVFDASAKTTTGTSLNELLLVGPTLQDDLFSLLVRFRLHPVALKADLEKMFRFIKLDPRDRDYLRIFWREKPSDTLGIYRLTTVTFGTACAPYQAVKTIQQLAHDEHAVFPHACEIIRRDFYVDDLMSGESSVTAAVQLQRHISEVMSRGQFNIRKWCSNNQKVLEQISPELRETQLPLKIDTDETVKTLGLKWHPALDHFSFSVEPFTSKAITKRIILSDIAKVFDPLGFLAPVTISAKILMQQLWKVEAGWDQTLPSDLIDSWLLYRTSLSSIQGIRIPRLISGVSPRCYQIHGFSDASEKAFSAVVYLRTVTPGGKANCNLVASKTKVAPLKQVSLPRLELCGAVLLSKLLTTIKAALPIAVEATYGWTDSTVVLHWIQSPPQRWKTFVANRVTEIQENLKPEFWNHIPGAINPADSASRGITPDELNGHPLWWHGPPFLLQLSWTAPANSNCKSEEAGMEERKVVTCHIARSELMSNILTRFSSLNQLMKSTAVWFRFAHKWNSARKPKNAPITASEMDHALISWVRYVQSQVFVVEAKALTEGEQCPPKSKLLTLSPFMDTEHLIRVGGRLRNADLPYDRKHPILLPQTHHLTKLIFRHHHDKMLHAGPQLLLHTVQQRFWVPRGKDVARGCVRKCITCFKQKAGTQQQLMGDLPRARVVPAPPFYKCGVDYAGPFLLRLMKGRTQKSFKAYVALFVCFTTRAIHLELVSDLSTDAFIAALKRFVGRRSTPAEIHSDCGTNFVGAARELKEFLAMVRSDEANRKVAAHLRMDGISWHFSPPGAPHFGGLWEAGVKSTKHHLKRVLGSTALTYEEFSTLLIQVEACLNSRPLCPLSSSPEDFSALTPGHFLTGRPIIAISEPDYTALRLNRLSRWQLLQQMYQHFWKRWQSEFLTRLQQRPKWAKIEENLRPGDMVLIKDNHLPPQEWSLGRIIEVHAGADELVRVVTVRTSHGTYKRPVTKVCKLPLDTPNQDPPPAAAEDSVENGISTRAGMLGQSLVASFHQLMQSDGERVNSFALLSSSTISPHSIPHHVDFSSCSNRIFNGHPRSEPCLGSTHQYQLDRQQTDPASGPLQLSTNSPE